MPSGAGAGAQATVVTYSIDGVQATQRIPADDWRPESATEAELAYFRVPSRPHDPADAEAWTDEWVNHYTRMTAAAPCADESGASATNGTTLNWSGEIAQTPGVTQAYGRTTYKAGTNCGDPALKNSWAQWVGIGGFNNSTVKLLQNGFIHGNTLGNHFFYEAIYGGWDTRVTFADPAYTYSVGDLFSIFTTYNTSDHSVSFTWHDLTTGDMNAPLTFSSFLMQHSGVPSQQVDAIYAYNGTTGEAIDERAMFYSSVNGNPYYGLLHNFGTASWTDAKVELNSSGSLVAMSSLNVFTANMVGSTGTILSDEISGSGASFTDNWRACGSIDPA